MLKTLKITKIKNCRKIAEYIAETYKLCRKTNEGYQFSRVISRGVLGAALTSAFCGHKMRILLSLF